MKPTPLACCGLSLLLGEALACGGSPESSSEAAASTATFESPTARKRTPKHAQPNSAPAVNTTYRLDIKASLDRHDESVAVELELTTTSMGPTKPTTLAIYYLPNEEEARPTYESLSVEHVYFTQLSFAEGEPDNFVRVRLAIPARGHLVVIVGDAPHDPPINVKTLTQLATRTSTSSDF